MKIFHVEHVPQPVAAAAADQFTSDLHALRYTSSDAGWKCRWSVPFEAMRYMSAFTKGAFIRWHIPPHGFAKFIDVIYGALWVLVARPQTKPGEQVEWRMFSHINLFHSFQVDSANAERYDIEAILVQAGTRL